MSEMTEYQLPEIVRTSLESLCLQVCRVRSAPTQRWARFWSHGAASPPLVSFRVSSTAIFCGGFLCVMRRMPMSVPFCSLPTLYFVFRRFATLAWRCQGEEGSLRSSTRRSRRPELWPWTTPSRC